MLLRDLSRPEAFRLLGFSHSPFGPLDDPASAWPRPSILGNVRRALAGGAAALAITGEEGRGKTSLIGPLKAVLGEGFTVGVLASGPAEDGVRRVLSAFEPGGAALARLEARNRLRDLSQSRHREGRPCVLLADDAHRIPESLASVLERSIGSGADGGAALRVILTAPRADLRRSPARVLPRVEIRLGPLKPEEVVAYIRHRLRVAGGPVDLFDEAAARALGPASGGAPLVLNQLCAACLEAVAARGMHRIDVDVVRAVSGTMRSAPPQAALGGGRSEPVVEPEPRAAATARSAEHLRVPAGSDEFLFSRSPKPASWSKPASHGPAERASASTGPALVAAIPAPETVEARAPHAPAERPDPVRMAGVEGIRASGHARATEGPASVRAAEPVAARDASRRWVAASTGAMMVVGMVIGAGIGRQMAPWSFAAGAGGTPVEAATPIGAGAATERAGTSSSPAVSAVPIADERGPSGDAIASSPASLAVSPQERESDARTLYAHAVDLAVEDPEAAIVAYARAALRGHARSARYLGQIYEIGDGVEASPELARAWYAFGEAGREAARPGSLDGASRPDRPSGAPAPMFSARMPDGTVELVWSGAGGEAGYRVEFARDPLAEPLDSLGTTISAALVAVPQDVAFWRVAATGGASEGWTPIESPATP